MDQDEIVNILDSDGTIIGTLSRKEAERDNHTTENALVFIFTLGGKVWAQLRAMTKSHFPGRWDISACGAVQSGEPAIEAAIRETKEETGLTVKLHYVTTFLNVFPGDNGQDFKRMSHLYVGVSEGTPLLNEEVDEFRAWDIDELKADIHNRPDDYLPPFLSELEMALDGARDLGIL